MSALERTAYVCLITLSLISGTILVKNSVQSRPAVSPPVILTEKDLAGRTLELPGADWKNGKYAAVLFISSHCHFCDASMPFYKRLIGVEHSSKSKHTMLSVVSREPTQDIKNHLALYEVHPDRIYQLPSTFTLLRGTPAILFVDHNGTIQHVFYGQLNGAKEKEVLDLFDDTCGGNTCQASHDPPV